MSLNVCATARTPPTPALLGSSHPPLLVTVAAQRPAACRTRSVCICSQFKIHHFPLCALTVGHILSVTMFVSRCVWSVVWFTPWGVNGKRAVTSAVAPSYRTKTPHCTLLSVLRLSVIGPALR